MVDDAIRSLHALFFTSLLVLLLWLLAWPAAAEKVRLTEDETLGEPKPPSNEPEDIKLPLEAIVTWPDERTEGFSLVHATQFNPRVMTLPGTVARLPHRDAAR